MMQCRDIDELMVEYLYQELDPARAAEFEAHVETCARCGAELGSLQRTRQALRALPDAEPPPALSARLLHEASRRAPNPEGKGLFAWLGRLFQPMLAHPALAATASVVLLLAVTTLVSVRARVSPHPQEVVLDKAVTPMAATAPASPPAPAAAPEQPVAAAEKAPEGAVAGESGELAMPPAAPGTAADKSEHRGRAPSDEEQKALKVVKKEAAGIRRDVTDALQQPAVHALEPKRAAAPPAPPKPSPPPAKKALATRGAAEESPADGYLEGERAANGVVADEKSRAKDSDLRSQSAAEVAQAPGPAPAESRPEPSPPPPPPQAPAPSTPQSVTGAEANARVASKPEANKPAEVSKGEVSKNDENRSDATKGGKARNEAPGAGGGSAPAATNAPASNDDTAGSDRPAAAAPPAAQAKSAPEPPEQQMYRQAQKQAAGGQCADALTLTRKIAKINPEFYKRR